MFGVEAGGKSIATFALSFAPSLLEHFRSQGVGSLPSDMTATLTPFGGQEGSFMTTFLRVETPDTDCVTIVFWSEAGITRCRMLGPTKMIFGQPFELHGPVAGSAAVARALEVGRRFADDLGVSIVIVDPARLWNEEWGTLTERDEPGPLLPSETIDLVRI
ncbi:hypothetical protein [Rhodoplanes sp. SY1]|uniref:hypothetical protein n=1 Tax=Rhodoplanes sp. SY1 TaxID=3166646 RepID=UPI0038B50D54